jgi:hypothetical protein
MNKKLLVLIIAATGTLFLLIMRYTEFVEYCDNVFLKNCLGNFEFVHNVLLFAPVVLFFSLLTYKMRDSVFTYWWKFARVGVPITLLIVTVVNLELHHNPAGEMQGILDVPFLFLVNAIFIIGSLIQIYRGYRK